MRAVLEGRSPAPAYDDVRNYFHSWVLREGLQHGKELWGGTSYRLEPGSPPAVGDVIDRPVAAVAQAEREARAYASDWKSLLGEDTPTYVIEFDGARGVEFPDQRGEAVISGRFRVDRVQGDRVHVVPVDALAAAAPWTEAKHPRDTEGRFRHKPGGKAVLPDSEPWPMDPALATPPAGTIDTTPLIALGWPPQERQEFGRYAAKAGFTAVGPLPEDLPQDVDVLAATDITHPDTIMVAPAMAFTADIPPGSFTPDADDNLLQHVVMHEGGHRYAAKKYLNLPEGLSPANPAHAYAVVMRGVAADVIHEVKPDLDLDNVTAQDLQDMGMSGYGMSSPDEGYAEMFAAFQAGPPTSEIPLVQAYAKREGWKRL
jgi:hypothetical protein